MSIEAHRSIDVDVFKEILDNEFFIGNKNEIPDLIDLVKKIQAVELKVQGIDLDHKREAKIIKHRNYGFRAKADYKIEFKQDVFENETLITLIPRCRTTVSCGFAAQRMQARFTILLCIII
ncbi:MAG: hypothetical protein PHF99_02670 [Bacteroidales bacterium]|nr:hypothetical protein [Bacteroidales bacterium]